MKRKFTLLLLSSLSLATFAAQAQTTFSIGPQASLNVAGATNNSTSNTTILYRPGFEAGVQSVVQFGHLAVQPSLRFSQKGLREHYGYDLYSRYNDYRLNYLTLPLNIAYSLRSDGQGLQVFAGPYVGLLLGGNYQLTSDDRGPFGGTSGSEGHIKPGKFDPYASLYSTSNDWYCRRFDTGLQVGLGYRYGKLLLQADFAFGLNDLDVNLLSSSAHNRTAQVSLAYLFAPKR